MALIREVTLVVVRDENQNINTLRYVLCEPLFGKNAPKNGDHFDGVIIENNSPFWLGQTLNLDFNGEEIALNLRLNDEAIRAANDSDDTLAEEIAEFIRAEGEVEVVEHVVDPAKVIDEHAGWGARVHRIPVRYFATHLDFVRDFRPTGTI